MMAATPNNGRRNCYCSRAASPASLLLALALLLVAATVQAFVVVAPAPQQAQRQRGGTATTTMSVDVKGAQLASRRDSLQRIGAVGALALLLGGRPGTARAAGGGDPKEAMMRVIVVRDSTAQLREELEYGTENNSDPDVRALVTSLLRNYRLKESLEAALPLGGFGSDAAREAAAGHGKAAVEDLSIIIEYFPEAQEGPIKNKIKLRPDELAFTLKALEAAGKELSMYLGSFPKGVVDGLAQEMNST